MRVNTQQFLTPKQREEFYINTRRVESKGGCQKINGGKSKFGIGRSRNNGHHKSSY
jgi:hypothetical protein